jgi:hypothetical protein
MTGTPRLCVCRIAIAALIVVSGAAVPAVAVANPAYTPTPSAELAPPPSPFEMGMRGFGTGLAAGLAGGYLFAREDGFTSRDWRPVVAGAGVGALAGGVVGFTLGMVDNNSTNPGRGFLVMRGMAYGGAFGAVAGGIAGGLAALSTDKPEHILFGAAIGTLSGTVLGLVLGSFERNPWAGRGRGPNGWSLGLSPCPTANGSLAFGSSFSGRF